MTAIAAILVFAGPLLVVLVFAREVMRQPHVREMRKLAVFERNRSRFGAIRTDLFAAARDGTLSPRDTAFQNINSALTALMRGPLEHGLAAQTFMTVVVEPNKKGEAGSAYVGLYIRLGNALDMLCRDHSRAYRYSAFLLDLAHKPSQEQAQPQPPLWLLMAVQRGVDAMAQRDLERKQLTGLHEASERLRSFGLAPQPTY